MSLVSASVANCAVRCAWRPDFALTRISPGTTPTALGPATAPIDAARAKIPPKNTRTNRPNMLMSPSHCRNSGLSRRDHTSVR